jgi:peptidylprolyl isomerase
VVSLVKNNPGSPMKAWTLLFPIILLSACATPLGTRSSREVDLPQPAQNRVPAKVLSMVDIINQAHAAEWRTIDSNSVLRMRSSRGDVWIELAQAFAPLHAQNIRTMARERYFDNLAITRSQDNFVVQWGDPNAENVAQKKSLGSAQAKLPAEFTIAMDQIEDFTLLPDRDGYAREVGFSNGFHVGRDRKDKLIWPAHCYGVVGAGRDVAPDSGSGAELYVVTGHAPRQLDRNIAIVGRVIAGMENLSTAMRGPAPMGFYTDPNERSGIESIRINSDLPKEEQRQFRALRTDSASFLMLVEARRNRRDDWYLRPAGFIDLCNVPLPVQMLPAQ